MSLIKENLLSYKVGFSQLFMLLRVISFEKFTLIFSVFYILFILSLSYVLSAVHWGVSLLLLLLAVVSLTRVLDNFQFLKRSLIHKNDRIEYADPSSEDSSKMFKMAKVLLKMKADEVRKTSLISEELMEGSHHFYLVQVDAKPTVIAYDWIMGLSPEMLDASKEFDDIQGKETTAQKE